MSVLSAVVVQVQNSPSYVINPCNTAHGLEAQFGQQNCVCQWTCIAADSLFELYYVVEASFALRTLCYFDKYGEEESQTKWTT